MDKRFNDEVVRKDIPPIERPDWLLISIEDRVRAWIAEGRKIQATQHLLNASKEACIEEGSNPVHWNYSLVWCWKYVQKLGEENAIN